MSRSIRALCRVLVLLLGCVTLVAGISKAQAYGEFVDTVRLQGMLPNGAVSPVCFVVVAGEIGCGAWIALGCCGLASWTRAATCLTILFGGFAVYCWCLVVAPPTIPTGCGCGIRSALVYDWRPVALTNSSLAFLLVFASVMGRGGVTNGEGRLVGLAEGGRP